MSIQNRLLNGITGVPGALGLWTRLGRGSVPTRVRYGAWTRPHYAYGVYSAADLAKRLELKRIAVLELGVAGGNGLVALRARLSGARLFIGNVRETIPRFNAQDHAPIGFVSFDLDYYSSTKDAFGLFEGGAQTRLPRVYCYMDDIIWPEYACQNKYVGELLAIEQFNAEHEKMKLCQLHLLRHMRQRHFPWNDQIYVLHDFAHPLYARNITQEGKAFREIPLG